MANYGAVIEVSVKGQQALDQLEGSARKIQSLIQGIKQQRNIFDQAVGSDKTRELKRNLENLVATFAGAKEGARQFKVTVGGTEQTVNMYSKTLAGLNSQLSTFRSIANNATVGTDQYRNAVVAANKVSNEFARTQAKAFNVKTSVSGMNVKDVIALGKSIPDTIEGLEFYQSALEDVLKTVRLGSNDFRALEEAIASTSARRNAARLTGQSSAISAASGPFSRIDTVAAFEKSASYAKQIADLEYKQLLTGQQLVKAKLSQSQQDELQNRLAQASEALANGELDVAKRLTVELRNQRILYERSNRAQEALMRPTSMTAGAAESVTGRRPGGLPPVPGSPAALAAAARAAATPAATPKAATATVDAQVAAQKRLNNLLTSAQILEQRSLEYKAKGLQVDQQVATAQNIINSIQENSNNVTKQYLDSLDGVLNSLRNELLLRKAIFNTQKAQTAEASKQSTGGKATTSTKKAGGAGFQNALIGGAFPLLFGGGAGAVVGGFAGGFIPGNPMLSIVTSAVGTIFDRIVAGSRVAGESVRTLDTALQHMADSNLFATKDTEFLAKKLEEYGRSSLAAQVVQDELNRKIGIEGVQSLQRLGDSSSELNKAWAEFNLQLQTALAGPLAGLLKWLADTVDVLNQGERDAARITTIEKGLTPAQQKAFKKERGAALPKGGFGTSPEYEAVLRKYEDVAKKVTNTEMKYSNEQIDHKIALGEKLYTELADLERELNDKKRQYAEQYADMVLALSRQQYDLTEQLQRKAFDTQVAALQQELKLLEKQDALRIDMARNTLRAQQLGAAPGLETGNALLSAIEEYRIKREEIDNQSANREREFKLQLLQLDIENERYKLDVAKTIQRTNYDNTIKIARINEEINKQNDAVNRKNYERRADIVSAELAVLRSQTIQLHAQADAALKQSDLTVDQTNYFTTLRDGLVKALRETYALQAKKEAGTLFNIPSGIPQMGALPALTANTAAIDAANKSLQDRITAYKELLQVQGKINEEEAARLDLLAAIEAAVISPISSIVKGQQEQILYQKYYSDEINQGTIPALANELAKIEALFNPAVKLLNIEIERLEAKKLAGALDQKELDLLNALIDRRDRLGRFTGAATMGAISQYEDRARLSQAATDAKGQLNELLNPANQLMTIAEGIGSAFSESFKGIVSGTMTAQEALAGFFQSVADQFLDMAAKIIAKWIEMTILNTVLQLFPGGATGSTTTGASLDTSGFVQYPMLEARANGGSVSSGSPYIVGERGPELFVPGKSGTIVPNNQLTGDNVSVVVNVDAKGTSVEGNTQTGNQLGSAISAAVQQELIKQKRPGGLLA